MFAQTYAYLKHRINMEYILNANITLLFTIGSQAVGVPGEVKGYHELWKEYGVLPWAELVQPTIDICEKGFQISKYMAEIIVDLNDTLRRNENLMYVTYVIQNIFLN